MAQWFSTRDVVCVFRGSGDATLDKNSVPEKTHLKRIRDCGSPSGEKEQALDAGATTRWFSLVGHTSRDLTTRPSNLGLSTVCLLRLFRCTLTTAHLIVERTRNFAKASPKLCGSKMALSKSLGVDLKETRTPLQTVSKCELPKSLRGLSKKRVYTCRLVVESIIALSVKGSGGRIASTKNYLEINAFPNCAQSKGFKEKSTHHTTVKPRVARAPPALATLGAQGVEPPRLLEFVQDELHWRLCGHVSPSDRCDRTPLPRPFHGYRSS